MHLTQGIHRPLQQVPDNVALEHDGRQVTFRQFADRVTRLAAGLHSIGVGEGDRVAMLSLNSIEYVEYYYAVWWAGAVANPINVRWAVAEIVYSLEDSDTTYMIVDAGFRHLIDEIRSKAPLLKKIVYIGEDPPAGTIPYESLIAQSQPVPDAYRHGDDLAAILYTGGTTGHPKGVMLSHTNIGVAGLMNLQPGLGLGPVWVHVMAFFHGAPLFWMLAQFLLGGKQIILPRFEASALIKTVVEGKGTDMLLVPSMIQTLIDHPEFDSTKFAGVRSIWYGASTIAEETQLRAMRALPNCKFIQVYALTEAPATSFLFPEFHDPALGKLRSTGRAVIETQIRICDPNGKELPRGQIGEINVRGMNAMLGYWNKPKETAATLVDGWVRTGDAAYMDDEGFVYIADRVKDMIVSGGENVFAAEVENAIAKHPAIHASAVIGIPSEQWQEQVHAILVLKPGAKEMTLEEMRNHCKQYIAGYKCPRSIEFRDSLPLTTMGKVGKNILRAPFWEGHVRKV
jgi:long-chain acyl-CoA synthetase